MNPSIVTGAALIRIFLNLFVASCAFSFTPVIMAKEVATITNIPYCQGQLLDIALPKGQGKPAPALVFVHGGGWTKGDRHNYDTLMHNLARMGVAGVSVDYRLAPAERFPAQVEDVKCAVRWLRAHAHEFNVDPLRIGAVGGSAGAHLVAMLGTTPGRFEGNGGYANQSSAIRCMVLHAGVYDLPEALRSVNPDNKRSRSGVGILRNLIGKTYEEWPKRYHEASPAAYVSGKAAQAFLIHGQQDDLVSYQQSQMFAESLRKSGVTAWLKLIPDAGHGGFGRDSREVSQQMRMFLQQCLLSDG